MRRILLLLSLLALAALPFAVAAQSTPTPIASGDTVEGEVTEAAPEAVYSFDGSAGDAVLITLVSDDFDPFLVLAGPDGEEVATDDDSAGNLDSQIETTLTDSGEYLITVTSFATRSGLTGAAGAYTLSLTVGGAAVPTASPLNVRPATGSAGSIADGDTVEGELTADEQAVDFSYEGVAGTNVTITLIAEDFDPYLLLTDPNGNTLATDDDSAGDLDSRISAVIPEDGTYTITATSYAANNGMTGGTGSFTLSVAVTQTETIEVGETVRGTFADGQFSQVYTFTAAAGDSVIIGLQSDDFDSYLRLNDPSGVEIAYNDDSGGNLNSQIGPLILSDSGVYTIIASSLNGSSAGDYTLTLNSANLTPVTVGEPVTGELTPANGSAFFALPARAGDTISVSVTSDIDTNVAILDPFNYQVAFDEDGGSGVNPELTDVVLTSDGQYSIVVSSPFGDTGEFTLEVSAVALPTLNDGPVTLAFNSSTTTRVVQYTAEAGENLRLTVTSVGGEQMSPSVDAQQDGTSVVYGSANYVTEFSMVFEVASSGDIVFTINEYSYENRQVEVRISSAD